jgi:DivIVA domain-containing protein
VRSIEARRQGRSAQRAEIRTRVPDHEVAAMQNARFPTAMRGYDRDEVDRYMRKVNTLIAELQITSAPESAIKAGLEQVRAERRSVIATAEQQAEEITRQSRAEADDRLQEAIQEARSVLAAAEQEADQLREAAAQEADGTIAGAETRIRALQDHVDEMQERRDRVLAELVELSRVLDELLERHGATGDRDAEPEPAPAAR